MELLDRAQQWADHDPDGRTAAALAASVAAARGGGAAALGGGGAARGGWPGRMSCTGEYT